jgi:hypothetical protein
MLDQTIISLSIPDAIKATGFSRTRLYELMGINAIQSIKVGQRTLIKAGSLRDYVDSLPSANIRKQKAH